MSSRTAGVAVAVSASTVGCPSAFDDAAEREIGRPEIVTPLADAVRFVDDEERHLDATCSSRRKRFVFELFRRR